MKQSFKIVMEQLFLLNAFFKILLFLQKIIMKEILLDAFRH